MAEFPSHTPPDVGLLLQVSPDENFSSVIVEEKLNALAENDYTVRTHISGLQPARHYYYRFTAAAGGESRTGRTMTAPALDDPTAVNLAFASCQNYEQGYYGAWARMVSEDQEKPADQQIHFVLHLGDFIYERCYTEAEKEGRFARRLPDFPDGATDGERRWAHTLADYRHLYKTYLADPHLQAARARWPFVCTWDDHEFSNDSFRHFSTYGDKPLAEPQRKRDAHRAWFEYIPALVPDNTDDLRIYRKLRWGKHVELLVTDLRSYRTPPPVPAGLQEALGLPMLTTELLDILDAGRDYGGGNPPAVLPFGDGTHPNIASSREPGSMLGTEQKHWFKRQLLESDANWKVWGNALPILPLRVDLGSLPLAGLKDSVLSDDAWAGYPGEYRELMDYLENHDITGLVSLSGDHHSQGAGSLAGNWSSEQPRYVAVDFNVTGISSSPQYSGVLHRAEGKQDFLPLVKGERDGKAVETWNMTLTQGVVAAMAFSTFGWEPLSEWLGPNPASPGLRYLDSNSNGYGLARFEQSRCRVQLVTVQEPVEESGDAGAKILHSANFELEHWPKGQQPQLSGPVFEGKPPFPFS
jgi:alkaline phosphatase D